MGCSAEGSTEGYINFEDQNTGLLSGHAYSIIDVIELDYLEDEKPLKKNKHGCHRLLRIRNPWGYGEWKLKWSENEEDGYNELILKHADNIK